MRKQKNKFNKFFLTGLLFFVCGIGGVIWIFLSSNIVPLDIIVSENVSFYSKFSIDKKNNDAWQKIFLKNESFDNIFDSIFIDKFSVRWEDLSVWVGENFGFIVNEKGSSIFALEISNLDKSLEFIKKFTIPGEKFLQEEIGKLKIFTPAFSSEISFGFIDKWLFIAFDKNTLKNILLNEKKLIHNQKYQEIKKDIGQDSNILFFADCEKLVHLLFKNEKWTQYKPLFLAIAKTLPAIGTNLNIEENALSLDTKFLSHKEIYSDLPKEKISQNIMPQLTHLGPKNVLFFMNGLNLYKKYQDTKNFLDNFHPQFSVIFDGILRAWAEERFGEKFDFEKDFLSHMHGQYAIMLDFEDEIYPFLYFTLITDFGGNDIEENLEFLQKTVSFAQSDFDSKIEKVSLPDGTVREELVSVKKPKKPIQKKVLNGAIYYSVENEDLTKNFSYAFLDNFLIFSTNEKGIKSVITTKLENKNTLAENSDFRKSILFRYSPSESYGFLNFSKLNTVLEFIYPQIISKDFDGNFNLPNFLSERLRNITFARKIFMGNNEWGEIFLNTTFFLIP